MLTEVRKDFTNKHTIKKTPNKLNQNKTTKQIKEKNRKEKK